MHFHISRLQGFVRLVVPRASRLVGSVGRFGRIHQPELYHTVVAVGAHHVPTLVVLALVLGYVTGLGVERPVGGVERDVHEEGVVLRGEVVEHVDGLLGDEVGGVEIIRNGIGVDGLLVVYEREGVEVVAHAPDGSPMLLEAAVAGIGLDGCEGTVVERVLVREPCQLFGAVVAADGLGARQVPLAAHAGAVACGEQSLGDGDALGVEAYAHARDAALLSIHAGEQRAARGAAATAVVELRETHSVVGEAVDVGRVDLAAEAAEVRVAHVIDHDEHDVRPFGLLCRRHAGKQRGSEW